MIIVPPQGTPQFDAFVQEALKNPSGPEALVLGDAVAKAQQEYAENVRKHLLLMQELVPGQLFRDIARFHAKFELPATEHPNHQLSNDALLFRIKFMVEELVEYCNASGASIKVNNGDVSVLAQVGAEINAAEALDALVDLVYVALGTAFLQRFKFNEAWARVQAANMAKVRAKNESESKRGSKFDVVKPQGWTAPNHDDLLGYACASCGKGSTKKEKSSTCEEELPSGLRCGGSMQ